MNELLKQEAETIIKNNKEYFMKLTDQDTIMCLCNNLSSFAYDNLYNKTIENQLFNTFVYLYNYNNELLKKTLTNKKTKTDLYQDTLKTIHELVNCIITINHLYDDIIEISNTITQKLYNTNYEEFLVNYVNK